MTDVKDNSWPPEAIIDDMLLELWGAKTYPIFDARANAIKAKLKTAILEEMDRVVAEVIDLGATADDHLPDKDKILVDMTLEDLKEIQRHRWQEVRGRL